MNLWGWSIIGGRERFEVNLFGDGIDGRRALCRKGRADMTNVELQAVEQLESYGFGHGDARRMVRAGGLVCPLAADVCRNAELLSRYISPENLSPGEFARALMFLKRDHSVNLFMASVPEKYAFTEEQRRAYFGNPSVWSIACDLREELDARLGEVIGDEEKRMDIYREMYCNGSWWDCGTIGDICARLKEIASGHEDLDAVVSRWWFELFSFYSGTLQYLDALENLFRRESVWEIFCDTIHNVREFSVQFNPMDRKEFVIEELRNKYPQYLK